MPNEIIATSKEIVDEVNRLYAALSAYKNTVIPQISAVMTEFELVAPVTPEQVNALPFRDRARLWKRMLSLAVYLAAEIGERKHEGYLSALGYASIADVIADAPNHLAGQDLIDAVNTFSRVGDLLTLIDSLLDTSAVVDITNRVCTASSATFEVAENIAEIKAKDAV